MKYIGVCGCKEILFVTDPNELSTNGGIHFGLEFNSITTTWMTLKKRHTSGCFSRLAPPIEMRR